MVSIETFKNYGAMIVILIAVVTGASNAAVQWKQIAVNAANNAVQDRVIEAKESGLRLEIMAANEQIARANQRIAELLTEIRVIQSMSSRTMQDVTWLRDKVERDTVRQ